MPAELFAILLMLFTVASIPVVCAAVDALYWTKSIIAGVILLATLICIPWGWYALIDFVISAGDTNNLAVKTGTVFIRNKRPYLELEDRPLVPLHRYLNGAIVEDGEKFDVYFSNPNFSKHGLFSLRSGILYIVPSREKND